MARPITWAKNRFFGVNFWIFYILIMVLGVVENGLWYSSPTELMAAFSQDLAHNPVAGQVTQQYWLSSFLGPLLGHITGMNHSDAQYALLHLGVFLLFFTCLVVAVRYRYGDFAARVTLCLFVLTPVSSLAFMLLGYPDGLVILLGMSIVIFRDRPGLLLPSAILLGAAHPEQGIIIIALLGIGPLVMNSRRAALIFLAYSLAGLVIGAGLVQWWIRAHDFNIQVNRATFILMFIGSFISQLGKGTVLAMLFSLFNAAIGFVILYIFTFWKTNKGPTALLLQIAGAFVVMLLTADPTRVFSLLMFPSLLLRFTSDTFLGMTEAQAYRFKGILLASVLLGMFIPRYYLDLGDIYYSGAHSLFWQIFFAFR